MSDYADAKRKAVDKAISAAPDRLVAEQGRPASLDEGTPAPTPKPANAKAEPGEYALWVKDVGQGQGEGFDQAHVYTVDNDGTIYARSYHAAAGGFGPDVALPSDIGQKVLDQIKAGDLRRAQGLAWTTSKKESDAEMASTDQEKP